MRAGLAERTANELLAFWAEHGFGGDEARRRLEEVVCVLRLSGAIAGASSVFAASLDLVAGRRFWIYRSLLPGEAAAHAHAMIRATFAVLDAEPREGDKDPVGLCGLLDGADRASLSPEADWRDPRMIYAGYLRDGRQVRIAYFSEQVYEVRTDEGGWAPPPGYRIDFFSDQDDVSREDLIALWTGEGVLSLEEAERRLEEVLLIATDPQRRPIAVATTYLERNDQLLAQMWYLRAFVAPAHRTSHFSVLMALVARDHLEQRFVSGADPRAIGMIFEIEYEPWKRLGGAGLWLPSDFRLIGENARGDHVRVRYFAGAQAPESDPGLARA